MRIFLDSHERFDLHAADGGRATNVVAGQIDQHEMLRAFLFVMEQFVHEAAVFSGCRAAFAGSRDGADGAAAIFQFDQRLRR